MFLPYNKKNQLKARNLRNNMTKEEKELWYKFLKRHSYRFLRQKIIENYIVDFYCPKARLVIELDGNQHYTKDGLEYDYIRTDLLNAYGLKVIRFKNDEINNNFIYVCDKINSSLEEGSCQPEVD